MKKENLEKIKELRHELHAWPELSMEETETKERLKKFLRENTSLEIEDRGHWFYAYYPSKNPQAEPTAFRADMDALPMEEADGIPYGSKNPGVCHKCGHDGHCAALAGLALEVDQEGADRPVYFIFQHAEEIGGGGEECAEFLTEKNIGRVFAYHNMSGYPKHSIVIKPGVAQCTSKGFTVSMKGLPAHASQPENGKNPSAALARLITFLEEMDLETGYDGLVLNTVVGAVSGGKNFGIAASAGSVFMTLRADYERDMARLENAVRAKAEELAEQYGLKLSFGEQDFFPETKNDDGCLQMVKQAAETLGLPLIELPKAFRGSEDFGYYLKKCPGAIFYIGNGETYPPLHTEMYDFNDEILETAADMFFSLLHI